MENTPKQPGLREGVDTPEAIVRTDLSKDAQSAIKNLSEQAFAGNAERQQDYAKKIRKTLLDHAKNYYSGDENEVLTHYWNFLQTSDARQIQIVHNRQDKTISVALLSETQTDITDKVLHKLYISRRIEQPKETRSRLSDLSGTIKLPPGKNLPPSPYDKDNADNKAA